MVDDESVLSERGLLQGAPGVTVLSFQRGHRTRGSRRAPCGPAEELRGQLTAERSWAITEHRAVAGRGKILSHFLERLLALGLFFFSFVFC